MNPSKRATIYLDPEIHRALRLKSAVTERSMSEMVNEAVRRSLAEDAEDLDAFEERAHEQNLDFENMVKALRRRGKSSTPSMTARRSSLSSKWGTEKTSIETCGTSAPRS